MSGTPQATPDPQTLLAEAAADLEVARGMAMANPQGAWALSQAAIGKMQLAQVTAALVGSGAVPPAG